MFALRQNLWTRRLLAVVSLWVAVVLAGQGHVIQALGLPLACEHGVDVAAATAGADSDDHPPAGDEDCPPNCTDCACGHMPMQVAELAPPLPFLLLEPHLLDILAPPALLGRAPPLGIERPPRIAPA